MKTWKKVVIGVTTGIILLPLLVVGSYVSYVALDYERIPDNLELEIDNKAKKETVNINEELKATSYNIGFGAYSDDYTFFLDTGYDENGEATTGYYAKGRSEEEVLRNTKGSIDFSSKLNSDFYLFQEVDTGANRSYFINQRELIDEEFTDFSAVYTINYDSAYLLYPFHDPIGKTLAGTQTLSKYKIQNSLRKSYTISTSFDKFFDLDRCFTVNRINTSNNKELILINSHMSAYDEGGYIRNTQIKELNDFMLNEVNKGNYVVCGGDFNHDLLIHNPTTKENYTTSNRPFKNIHNQKTPDWVSYIYEEDGTSGIDSSFKIFGAENEPTCRSPNEEYNRGTSFVTTVDGFIVSSNVEVSNIEAFKVGEQGFAYSDHQPTTLTFKLK